MTEQSARIGGEASTGAYSIEAPASADAARSASKSALIEGDTLSSSRSTDTMRVMSETLMGERNNFV